MTTRTRRQLAVMMMRLRSNRSAMAPAHRPSSNHGSRCSSAARATRVALRVWEATRSGPAARAMPSPMLLDHEADMSHRNGVSRRAGAMNSPRRDTRDEVTPQGRDPSDRQIPTPGASSTHGAPCAAALLPVRRAGKQRISRPGPQRVGSGPVFVCPPSVCARRPNSRVSSPLTGSPRSGAHHDSPCACSTGAHGIRRGASRRQAGSARPVRSRRN